MALSRTPLAPDPGYEHTCNFYPRGAPSHPIPRGRVRPEAVDIARLHTKGSIELLLQLQGEPSHRRFKRPETKNHFRENHHRIHQIQSRRRQREEEEEEVKPVYVKSDKYDHVQPKVTVHMQHSRSLTAPPPSHLSSPPKSTHAPSAPVSQLEPTRVPVNGTPVTRPHTTQSKKTKNFLAANVAGAAKHQVRQPPSKEQLVSLHSRRKKEMDEYQRGKVPHYLRQRQAEWHREEEERLAALPDPSVPPGHTVMSREEKKKTLDVLTEHQGVLTQELLSLPLHSDTLRVREKRSELEARLAEIEDAIKIFSRPKVFVKLDE